MARPGRQRHLRRLGTHHPCPGQLRRARQRRRRLGPRVRHRKHARRVTLRRPGHPHLTGLRRERDPIRHHQLQGLVQRRRHPRPQPLRRDLQQQRPHLERGHLPRPRRRLARCRIRHRRSGHADRRRPAPLPRKQRRRQRHRRSRRRRGRGQHPHVQPLHRRLRRLRHRQHAGPSGLPQRLTGSTEIGDPDLNGDGEVNTLDFLAFLNLFVAGCD